MSKKILVTGGAGYVGIHVVYELIEEGFTPVVIDDLRIGRKERLPPGVHFYEGSYGDTRLLDEIFQKESIEATIHLAALKDPIESLANPFTYWNVNVTDMSTLIQEMSKHEVRRIIFSSSAAVYGHGPIGRSVREEDPVDPLSPYGLTKYVGENLLDLSVFQGFTAISLRYFNVAGARSVDCQEQMSYSLIPSVVRNIATGITPTVYGDTHPTRDGTCIRDYVHVWDIARAHVYALQSVLQSAPAGHRIYNVGSARGASVKEVISLAADLMNVDLKMQVAPTRIGDPISSVADNLKIKTELGWRPKYSLEDILESVIEAVYTNDS